ncbi:MAG: NUMOD4 motif-containing HNH endonuclease [Paraclostridium sp.]
MDNEIWKPIPGYEGLYEASTEGRIRSVDRVIERSLPGKRTRICNQKGVIIKPVLHPGRRNNILDRCALRLSKNGKTKGFQWHRLIAETFLGSLEGLEVNHINGDPKDNRLANLELVTRLENIRHAFRNGLYKTSKAILKLDIETNDVVEEFYSESEGCRRVGVPQGYITRAIKNNNGILKGFKFIYKENA